MCPTIITWVPDEICDFCGAEGGAYEYLGDFYCKECMTAELGHDEIEDEDDELETEVEYD